jgi:hypothetical protein
MGDYPYAGEVLGEIRLGETPLRAHGIAPGGQKGLKLVQHRAEEVDQIRANLGG